ncbi:uncharacterized protein LOC110681641 [Chenopodium quinoa]|uniref:uncharacterized protein LOC110681641 n=1 Tax=Chenopodium quinoa TaxID=63459 RepID=UPI000B799122|nr:uncharacterized protein LOC110681641 [Chenopodium quinoa]
MNSGFVMGDMPFRYLGIPLNAKYLKVNDYDSLIDKMLMRLQCWSSRNLSYTARVTLVNSVLMSLHTYWAQCVLLPKKVLCRPKRCGGLGIRNCRNWNRATLGNYVRKIAKKSDSLWVRWVHSVYIKEDDWWDYKPKKDVGWAWKLLCKVKDELREGFETEDWLNKKYRIKDGYKWLQGNMDKANWYDWVWNPFNIPNHTFIYWLLALDRLRTRDRLAQFGVCNSIDCLLCGEDVETSNHLFFGCSYSTMVIDDVAHWLGFLVPFCSLLIGIRTGK